MKQVGTHVGRNKFQCEVLVVNPVRRTMGTTQDTTAKTQNLNQYKCPMVSSQPSRQSPPIKSMVFHTPLPRRILELLL